jgi:hypothetical protein
MMRAAISLMCAVALGFHAPALPQPVPDKATKLLNDPLIETECVSEAQGVESRRYPFSVSAIQRALDIAGVQSRELVHVLVVDNNFYGYRTNESGGGPPRLSSRNFPKDFFEQHGDVVTDDFAPWVGSEDPEVASPPADLVARHGTHVAGIVLGGMYDDENPPEDANLQKPSARGLLLDSPNSNKTWLRISFLKVRYGTDSPADDPVTRLANLDTPFLATQKIVNMSLGRALSGSEGIQPLPERERLPSLIVTSAGNSGRELTLDGSGVRAVPAILDDDGRMLVVASHDANGQLSRFSNYGMPVTSPRPAAGSGPGPTATIRQSPSAARQWRPRSSPTARPLCIRDGSRGKAAAPFATASWRPRNMRSG